MNILLLVVPLMAALPTNFSWANVDGVNYMGVNINQNFPHRCEGGWAFGTINMLNARIKRRMNVSNYKYPLVSLSPQVLIDCDSLNMGCYGGEPLQALRWIAANQITDDSCSSYRAQSGVCDSKAKCQTCIGGKCRGQINSKVYALGMYGSLSGADDMMAEIIRYGPVVCGISMTDDLKNNYVKGIYKDGSNSKKFNHYVTVYGWGESTEGKYWNIMNSFGPAWGEEGSFRLAKGTNNLGVQSLCYWGTPLDTWSKDQRNNTLPNSQAPVTLTSIQALISSLELIARKQAKEEPLILSSFLMAGRNMYSVKDCNASWAFATTQMVSDRLYKSSKGLIHKFFSVQVLLNCGVGSCSTGDAFEALNFMKRFGIPEEGCQPYKGENPLREACDGLNNCGNCFGNSVLKTNCSDYKNFKRWKVGEFGVLEGIAAMKGSIDVDGPIVCGIQLTNSFRQYQSGVFSELSVAAKINHFVEIVGYKENEYWIGRQSFGTAWGLSGFFKIKMGSANLGLQSKCYYSKNII